MIKPNYRTILKQANSLHTISKRTIRTSSIQWAKNDDSTIDSFKLPSQTSINEWEFKYDFIPKVSSPKVPPVTPEAVKQDIAQDKKASVEREMFTKEANSSVKVEANTAPVVHGGEAVQQGTEFLEDRGSTPVDVVNKFSDKGASKKTANRDQYVQSSINPDINKNDVVRLGENEVDESATPVKQSPVIEDIEYDNLTGQEQSGGKQSHSSSINPMVWVGAFALGWGGYSYYSSNAKKNK